jgi:hypothetical protein
MIERKCTIVAGLLIIAAYAGSGAAVADQPTSPSNPKSQSEFTDWGRAYQSWWDTFLSNVRQQDAVCKSHYSGQYTTIESICGNTIGSVTHENPCDQTTYYTQCEWIGFFHGMGACLSGVAGFQRRKAKVGDDGKQTTLELDDVAFVQKLAKQDEFIRKLSASADGLDALGKVLDLVATGPTKLVVQWDQALIRGWRQANKAIDVLNKHQICDEITEHSLDTKALQYFDELYKARGCDQY